MTVAQLKKQLQAFPKDAVVVLAVQVRDTDADDHYTVEEPAATVVLRPDLKVQIGDENN